MRDKRVCKCVSFGINLLKIREKDIETMQLSSTQSLF